MEAPATRTEHFSDAVGDTYSDRIEFDCERFNGAAGRIFSVDRESSLDVTSRKDIEVESIQFLVKGPGDKVLWEHSHDEAGAQEQQILVEAYDTGRYEMRVKGSDIQGSFELRWKRNE